MNRLGVFFSLFILMSLRVTSRYGVRALLYNGVYVYGGESRLIDGRRWNVVIFQEVSCSQRSHLAGISPAYILLLAIFIVLPYKLLHRLQGCLSTQFS